MAIDGELRRLRQGTAAPSDVSRRPARYRKGRRRSRSVHWASCRPPDTPRRPVELFRPARSPLSLDEVKESITAKGRERGFVTSEDLLEAVPVDDFTPEQVEEFLTQVQDHLTAEGIEVIEVPGEETDAATQVRIEVDLLKAPTNDPVRMYLKEIGKVPLLNAAQEIDLARRIEAGELSTALQPAPRRGRAQGRSHDLKVCVDEGLGDPQPPAHRLRQGRGHRPREDREELPAEDRRRAAGLAATGSSATGSSPSAS